MAETAQALARRLIRCRLEQPEICEYPDSGQYLAEGSLDSEQPFEVIARRGPSLDCWDGEL